MKVEETAKSIFYSCVELVMVQLHRLFRWSGTQCYKAEIWAAASKARLK